VNHHEFDALLPGLLRSFRVIAPDLPGFGESERPRDFPYHREGYAETLCDLLAGLDVGPVNVAGHSLGGAISLVLAADHPERVAKLALINSVSYPFELPFKARIPQLPVLGEFVFKRLYNRALMHDYFTRNVFAPGFKYDRASVDGYYRAFDPPDARDAAYRVLHTTLDMASLGPKIPKVRAPTLVLWGELDPMFPVALGARLAREIPGARFETVPGSGHSPPEEAPEKTVELLTRHFLGEAR
jgi:pimeloyl-ACP methyl ester carboxylesterase